MVPLLDIPDDPPLRAEEPADPLRCTDRARIPQLNDVFEAAWSPDSSTLALSHIVTIENDRMITGYEEDQRLALFDVATGTVTERGVGSEPSWSGSGTYLSYWHDPDALWVVRRNTVLPVAVLRPTIPEVRWVGDEIFFFSGSEIHSWTKAAGVRGVATVPEDLKPKYPHDDVYFSGDGALFTMTRYASDGSTARYIGSTKTGDMTPLDDGGATFVEWSPLGDTLLLRSQSTLALVRGRDRATIATTQVPSGTVHTWTSDGRILLGRMGATVPAGNAFDEFTELDEGAAVATLPNLLGIRSFSPDGGSFVGVSRTGTYSTQLELFRCGVTKGHGTDLAADESTRVRADKIGSDPRRFVRPGAAAITQFLQGSHTGIDIAAPYGTLLVAADDGVVDAVGLVPVGGRRVCVQHPDGLESCDYHTALSLVAIGEKVVRGQPVALMGLTGVTTGPHVHWEAKRNGMIVDPLKQ